MAEDSKYTDPDLQIKEVGIQSPLEKRSAVDKLKVASNGLRGNVLNEVLDEENPAVSGDSYQLMKHFGMYQQDDRDVRKERRKQGLDKDYSFMLRTKIPGGLLSAEQYLILDECADQFANGSVRLTTRQTIQFHGVGKQKLQGLSRALNEKLLTTYGACGDVVRNTMYSPIIDITKDPKFSGCEVFIELGRQISDRTLPRTNAFYDIFIDGEKSNEDVPRFELRSPKEDIYGESYMPRKFKIGISIPEDNSSDLFTQDLGIVAIRENGKIKGYNIYVGGGLGHSHSNKKTYARASEAVAYVSPDDILATVDAVITIQRDYGNRLDRKQARLKYLLDAVGPKWFFEEMQRRVGEGKVHAPVEIPESAWEFHDHMGWFEQKQPGQWYVGIYIESGRIIDRPGKPQKKVLKEIIEKFSPGVRVTPQQNLILTHIDEAYKEEIDQKLRDAGFLSTDAGNLSQLRRDQISCVALPTCGLALAEAERAMPTLMDQLEEKGYGDLRVGIRMSGCPNSCSRPPAAELGIIGCAPDKYNIYVGGDYEGTRINQLFKEKVTFEELANEIAALFDRWKKEANDGEAFGDWSYRLGVEKLLEA